MPESPDPMDSVDALLRSRADRGMFRSFAAARQRGRLVCSFVWLRERPIRLIFDPRRGTLEFRDLLPDLAANAPLYKDLRGFLGGLSVETLPSHRRIDSQRAKVQSRNRKGSVSVLVHSLDRDWDYAVGKALKLVNEIFLGFLRGPYYEYMVENFHEPQD
jgi:hypothetical protein